MPRTPIRKEKARPDLLAVRQEKAKTIAERDNLPFSGQDDEAEFILYSEACKLRAGGMGYRQIGEQLHLSASNAHAYVKKGQEMLQSIGQESLDQIRSLELQRLDQMFAGIWIDATSGKVSAVMAAISIMKRRSELLGLDAPKNVKVDGKVSHEHTTTASATSVQAMVNDSLQALIVQARAKQAALQAPPMLPSGEDADVVDTSLSGPDNDPATPGGPGSGDSGYRDLGAVPDDLADTHRADISGAETTQSERATELP